MGRTKKTNVRDAQNKTPTKKLKCEILNMEITPLKKFRIGGETMILEKFNYTQSPREKSAKNKVAEAMEAEQFSFTYSPLLTRKKSAKHNMAEAKPPGTPIFRRSKSKVEDNKKKQECQQPQSSRFVDKNNERTDICKFTTKKTAEIFSEKETSSPREKILNAVGLQYVGDEKNTDCSPPVFPAAGQLGGKVPEKEISRKKSSTGFSEKNAAGVANDEVSTTSVKIVKTVHDAFPAKKIDESFCASPVFRSKIVGKTLRVEDGVLLSSSISSFSAKIKESRPTPHFPAKIAAAPKLDVQPACSRMRTAAGQFKRKKESNAKETQKNFNASSADKESFSKHRDEKTSPHAISVAVDVEDGEKVVAKIVSPCRVIDDSAGVPLSPERFNDINNNIVCTPNFNRAVDNLIVSFRHKYENILKRKWQQMEAAVDESVKKKDHKFDAILAKQAEERKRCKNNFENALLDKVYHCLNETNTDDAEEYEIYKKVKKFNLSGSGRGQLLENYMVAKKTFADYNADVEKLERKHKKQLQDFRANVCKNSDKMPDEISDRNKTHEGRGFIGVQVQAD